MAGETEPRDPCRCRRLFVANGVDIKTLERIVLPRDLQVDLQIVLAADLRKPCQNLRRRQPGLTEQDRPPMLRAEWKALLHEGQLDVGQQRSNHDGDGSNNPEKRLQHDSPVPSK